MTLSTLRKRAIKRFVRGVLGCQCPDEVFRSIEASPGPVIGSGLRVGERIVVGQRLLIYLVDGWEERDAARSVEEVIEQGVRDRDEHGLNRFRLVLAGAFAEAAESKVRKIFQELSLLDERVHLHVVSRESLP